MVARRGEVGRAVLQIFCVKEMIERRIKTEASVSTGRRPGMGPMDEMDQLMPADRMNVMSERCSVQVTDHKRSIANFGAVSFNHAPPETFFGSRHKETHDL